MAPRTHSRLASVATVRFSRRASKLMKCRADSPVAFSGERADHGLDAPPVVGGVVQHDIERLRLPFASQEASGNAAR